MGRAQVGVQFGWTPQNSVRRKCPLPAGCPARLCGGEGKGGVTYEEPGCQVCQLLRWRGQQRAALCAHAHTHTHRTRPTAVLSKNGSSSLAAKIKEPLGGQPPEETSLLWPLLSEGLSESQDSSWKGPRAEVVVPHRWRCGR